MRTYLYPQFPLHLSTVHVALYAHVTNCDAILASIQEATSIGGIVGKQLRERVDFAFINAHLITSRLHLQTAVYQAILAAAQGLLHTKSVHAEILWALNPTCNVAEGLSRYGISSTSSALFVVCVTSPNVSNLVHKMDAVVTGILSSPSDLDFLTDWATIMKYYHLTDYPSMKGSGDDLQREHAAVDNIIVSTLAMKSILP